MPTNRRRKVRPQRLASVSPAELEWMTGEPQPGANRFWIHTRGDAKVARCMALMQEYAELIPPGRLPALEADLEFWGDRHADRSKT
ncbi:MAG: hypothetical protein WCV99_12425 [Sterolibacterium sp.]|jgi:hypothetical protein